MHTSDLVVKMKWRKNCLYVSNKRSCIFITIDSMWDFSQNIVEQWRQ